MPAAARAYVSRHVITHYDRRLVGWVLRILRVQNRLTLQMLLHAIGTIK